MIKNLFNRSGSGSGGGGGDNGDYNPGKEYLGKRRAGITSQHLDYDQEEIKSIAKYPKTKGDEIFIKSAIENNDFLSNLMSGNRLQNVIDCMYPKDVNAEKVIITEGEIGSHLYVSVRGTYEIIKNQQLINTFCDVRIFGELALLYNAKRLATIKARTMGKIFVLNRNVFKYIIVNSDREEIAERVTFLQNVPKLNTITIEALEEVANLLVPEFYVIGTKIVRQGEEGNKFYIIRAGSVTVSTKNDGDVDKLFKGHFFGELALTKTDVRQATVTADAPGVECLTLERQHFIDHFGEIKDCFTINLQAEYYTPIQEIVEYTDLNLSDFKILDTLGIGGFGRVELVQHSKKTDLVFALKIMKKYVIVAEKQVEHVFNEKNVQISCNNPFIVRLYRTYKDNKYLYLLLESCLGGDLWSFLHKQKPSRHVEENDAKFYAGCVIEALAYLHERGIIYRDLKPENLLIDAKGYLKLIDFGFAKLLESQTRTYTFAGTPEYVPPEIILNRGHNKAVDFWELGIFIFELLTGHTPFWTNDSSYMKTYRLILKGIENVEFPSSISPNAKNIIQKLCTSIPSERLGCQRNGVDDIRNHLWFEGFDWDQLRKRQIQAPFRPNLKNNTDTHYFEKFPKDNDIPPEETSGWDKDF